MTSDPRFDALAGELAVHGLILRGGFHPEPGDDAPEDAATLLLVGNAGAEMWPAFSAAGRSEANPMNAWTVRVVAPIAAAAGGRALYPFDGPPYRPFQRWALRAEAVHPSPLGILIHPDYGLWHAYRAALVFSDRIALPPRRERPSPCASCADRPCLSACPVDAFTPGAYDAAACRAHIASPAGADCMDLGCRARRACPVGDKWRYEPDQARFHMAAFRRGSRTG